MLPGIANTEGAMLVRSADGLTVVLNDVVFNMDKKKDTLGYVITSLLGSAPGPRVSRLVKLLMVKDRPALRAELERLAALPELVRVVVSHEKVGSGPAASDVLRKAATSNDSWVVEWRWRSIRSRPKSCSAARALCAAQRTLRFSATCWPPRAKGRR